MGVAIGSQFSSAHWRPSSRAGFGLWILVIVLSALVLSGCMGNVRPGESIRLPHGLIAKYNAVANAAVARHQRDTNAPMSEAAPANPHRGRKPTPVATPAAKNGATPRTTSFDPMSVAMAAVLNYDRNHAHRLFASVRKIGNDARHGYISDDERLERYLKVFVDRGVIPNRDYSGPGNRLLLPLAGYYAIPSNVRQLLHKRYGLSGMELPALRVVHGDRSGLGNNFVLSRDIAVLDPTGIRRMAYEFALNPDRAVQAFALHELVHHVHNVLLPGGKFESYRRAQGEINTGAPVHFYHWREAEEFMADAVMVQLGIDAIGFVASRMLHGRTAIEDPVRGVRRRAHDASARFFYLLLREAADETGDTALLTRLHWMRAQFPREPKNRSTWLKHYWHPWAKHALVPGFVDRVRHAYAREFDRVYTAIARANPHSPWAQSAH